MKIYFRVIDKGDSDYEIVAGKTKKAVVEELNERFPRRYNSFKWRGKDLQMTTVHDLVHAFKKGFYASDLW